MLAKAVIRDRPRRQLSMFASHQQFLHEIKAEETYRRLGSTPNPPSHHVRRGRRVVPAIDRHSALGLLADDKGLLENARQTPFCDLERVCPT
jgi:hypothetical protein